MAWSRFRRDPGDYQRVDLVGFGGSTAPAAEAGGQLGRHLPDIQTGPDSSYRHWATERAGHFHGYPGHLGVLRPGHHLRVTGKAVSDGPVFQGYARVVHQTGRKGILVRVDPDYQHWFSNRRIRRFVRERQKAR